MSLRVNFDPRREELLNYNAMEPSSLERQVMSKATWRLVPFMCLCYLTAFLDRVNVGFAALEMKADLKFSEAVYGMGAGIFFVGYFLFEVPSNVLLERIGARIWIARIMILWGLISSGMMLVKSAWMFYVARFLLGAGEAGFFPGMILYLTYWFPTAYRSRTVALFMAAAAMAGVVGSPLSGLLMDHHPAWIKGWQWLFVVEGIPSVILGSVVLLYLPNGPKQARWLEEGELSWLTARLDLERAEREKSHEMSLWEALSHPRVLILSLLYFLIVIGGYGLDMFLPDVLKLAFPFVSKLTLGLIAAIPPLFTVFVMIFWGRHSDARHERRWHVALPGWWAALGLTLATLPIPPIVSVIALSLAVSGRWSSMGPFWGLPTAFLSGTAAAGGIALINSVGNLGGFAGPYLMGWFKDHTGDYHLGLRLLAGAFVAGGLLALSLKIHDSEATGPGPDS
ncbi:MAG TPA: MFS transporter [Planctomycetota bacterium]|nr:MFS transporter [Planctomycetota bacterium]